MPHITINPSQSQFQSTPHESILSAAIRNGHNLPHSCQSGVCGSCRARLLSGEVKAIDEYDDYVLSDEERADGIILLCCCEAQSDVEIDMPAYAGSKAIQIRTLPAKVASIEQHHQVAILKVALPKAPPFKFYPGQYMDILLKDGQRSYSIANPPSQNEYLEFHVRHQAGGLFSPMLFDERLKAGAIIRLRGPLGGFSLNEESDKPILFLATGTGLAPIKAMLRHLLEHSSSRSIHLYWGVRSEQDLYDESLKTLISGHTHIRYTPVLSRPSPEWRGASGHIQNQVLADYQDLSDYEVYACGSLAMIQEAQGLLTTQLNLPEAYFFSDAFTPSR